MTAAETLRNAASLIRERAEAAARDFPEPWDSEESDVVGSGERWVVYAYGSDAERAIPHVASWHPAVALAVADWLDWVADGWSWNPQPIGNERQALAVANAYLGGES